ncbi:hypothetical protein GE061_013050 [Apolygus lucorum]|uniref:Uncharacterized protein n=1 Tax=Apolygus lucorum TaxID=248454 RepID=A0A8S9XUB9_APOLU|nr:hypothetical protein GE061_013050 [Apolygus lucorum]
MLNKFCFFLSLSTGSLIIGVFNVFYGLFTLVVQTRQAVHPLSYRPEVDEMEHVVSVLYTEDSIFTMQLLFGFYLIYGTLKEKQGFVFASMVLHLALAAYSAFFVVFAMLTMISRSQITDEYSLPNGEQIANEALKIPIFMYFAFVIYGRHEELTNKSPQLMESFTRGHNTSEPEELNSS